jgi:hypothetical protein
MSHTCDTQVDILYGRWRYLRTVRKLDYNVLIHIRMDPATGGETGRQNQLRFAPRIQQGSCLIPIHLHFYAKQLPTGLLASSAFFYFGTEMSLQGW